MGPPSYMGSVVYGVRRLWGPSFMGSVVDRRVVMRRVSVVDWVCKLISIALYRNGFTRVNFICQG